MAVAIVQKWLGVTLNQFDQITPKLDSTSCDSKGTLSHWVVKSEAGILVVDIWETREEFQKFADEQLVPTAKELGMPNPPEIAFHELPNYFPKDVGQSDSPC